MSFCREQTSRHMIRARGSERDLTDQRTQANGQEPSPIIAHDDPNREHLSKWPSYLQKAVEIAQRISCLVAQEASKENVFGECWRLLLKPNATWTSESRPVNGQGHRCIMECEQGNPSDTCLSSKARCGNAIVVFAHRAFGN